MASQLSKRNLRSLFLTVNCFHIRQTVPTPGYSFGRIVDGVRNSISFCSISNATMFSSMASFSPLILAIQQQRPSSNKCFGNTSKCYWQKFFTKSSTTGEFAFINSTAYKTKFESCSSTKWYCNEKPKHNVGFCKSDKKFRQSSR